MATLKKNSAGVCSSDRTGEGVDRRSEHLEEAFRVFVSTSQELEEAFERLRVQGEEVDRKVHKVNLDLRRKVCALEDLRSRLGSVFEALPTGVISMDPDGRITLMNGAAEEILSVRAKDSLGRNVLDLPLGEQLLLSQCDEEVGDALGGKLRQITNAAGECRTVEGRVEWIRGEQGVIEGRVEFITDRTEVVDLEKRMMRLDKLAALGEMAAGIAHEVRNPLHGSIGFAELLGKEISRSGDRDRMLTYVEKIRHGIRKVDSIIESVLTWARPEEVETTTVDLGVLLQDAVETVSQGLPGQDAEHLIQLRVAGSADLRVKGDPVRLYRVVENLLRNAVESMPHGGTIDVTSEVERNQVLVHVADRGCGIKPEHLEKIFQPFFTTKGAGTGLGLFFTQRILDVHGGEVSLMNREGGGVCATIRLSCPMDSSEKGEAR